MKLTDPDEQVQVFHLKRALDRGWQIDRTDNVLYKLNDVSNKWAAVWVPMWHNGFLVKVPNWLPRRLHELEEECVG